MESTGNVSSRVSTVSQPEEADPLGDGRGDERVRFSRYRLPACVTFSHDIG